MITRSQIGGAEELEGVDRGGALPRGREGTATYEEPTRGSWLGERNHTERRKPRRGFAEPPAGHRGLRHLRLRLAAPSVGVALVLVITPLVPAYAATTVTFADSNLESAARVALSKPAGDVTEADMATLTSLDATSQGIGDLDGLQYATNLTNLDLSDNQITDLTPLSGLTNLTDLDLSGNQIATITPVLGLKSLATLGLGGNQISDVVPVASLTDLNRLDLSDNKITTVTVLGALRPGTADVAHNWLDVSAGSAAMAVIDGWLGNGASVAYLPQGRITTCVVSTTSKTIGYAAKTAIAGTLSDSGTADRVGGCSVRLQSSSDGTTFKDTTASYATTPEGTFAFTVTPTTKAYYRVIFAGSGYYYLASTSPTVCFTPRVYLSTPAAPSTAYRSRAFASYAYLKQRHTAGTYPVRLQCYRLERQSGGTYKWILRKTVSAKAANYSTYTKVTAAVALPYSGRWRIRAYHAADSLNAATYSSYRYLSVEDRRIEAAIRWARARLGSHTWDHYCMRFVNDCYERGAGATVYRYRTAKQAADALHAAAHPSTNAPRGTYVFYHSIHGGVDLGHVGISLGNGTMISDNGSEGVCIKPMKYGLRYIGWAVPPISPRITDWD